MGVVYAGFLYGNVQITAAGALALSLASPSRIFRRVPSFPCPLRAAGMNALQAFVYGVLSGIVEPIGAMLTVFASGFFVPIMPYLLSFAAGAMIYVVVEELIPEMSEGAHSNTGTIAFAMGFVAMMTLDTALG